ncbi:MAG: hypothetical protein JWN30_2076 [Bacilli bacterium]|nr:hypothetical protein [Bacilli bacterium]
MRIQGSVVRIAAISKSVPVWSARAECRYQQLEKRLALLDQKMEQELRASQQQAADEARYDFYERTWAAVDARARVAERAREHDEEIQEAKEREAHLREDSNGGGGT